MQIFRQLAVVLKQPLYSLIALATGLVVFSMAVWLPNLALIRKVLLSDAGTGLEKLHFLVSLYGSITTNFTFLSAIYTILIAMLFGIYLSLLIHFVKKNRRSFKATSSVAGISGLLSGLLGIGCAACGSVVFMSLFTAISGGAFLTALPYEGREFGILGIALLVIAIKILAQRSAAANICLV